MQNEENKVKVSFFQGVKSELKKVVWPTGRQTAKNTLVIIVFVLIISVLLGVFNLLFKLLSDTWYNLVINKSDSADNQIVVSDVSSNTMNSSDEIVLPSGEEYTSVTPSGEENIENEDSVQELDESNLEELQDEYLEDTDSIKDSDIPQ